MLPRHHFPYENVHLEAILASELRMFQKTSFPLRKRTSGGISSLGAQDAQEASFPLRKHSSGAISGLGAENAPEDVISLTKTHIWRPFLDSELKMR